MAVPGRIDSGASQGCHKLLKEGARLVTRVEDVIEELQDLFGAGAGRAVSPKPPPDDVGTPPCVRPGGQADRPAAPAPQLSEEARAVLAKVEDEGSHVDALIRATGLDAGKVNAILVSLQIRRQVRLLPGGVVKRI
ncbi:MAG: hypothetical protein FWH21_08135 [Kiritimatiellaeota bacterium]|nr:hypothetical protein [Kiritimatiellota bacterium]